MLILDNLLTLLHYLKKIIADKISMIELNEVYSS